MPLQSYQKPQGQMGLLGQPRHYWSKGVPHLKIQDGAYGTYLIIKIHAIKATHQY